MEIFSKFGVDWRLFAAQLINFAILLYVLKRFAYAPMTRFLDARREKIERGLRRAEESEEVHRKVKVEVEEIVLRAKREAKEIVDQAHTRAKETHKAVVEKAHGEAHAIVHAAKRRSEEEREAFVARFQTEIAELVALAAEKVVGKKWNGEDDRKMIENVVGEMGKK